MCILRVHPKFQLNWTITGSLAAFQRKSIILFGTMVVTLITPRNDLGLAQIKDLGLMQSFTGKIGKFRHLGSKDQRWVRFDHLRAEVGYEYPVY